MPALFPAARAVLERAVAERAFPAAVIEVGDATRTLWREAFGTLTFDADAASTREDTIFDLASLTKVLATTPLVMRDVEQGALGLDDRLMEHLPRCNPAGADLVTIRDLLSHCSGLPAHLPLYREHQGRQAFEAAICAAGLEYPPHSKSLYSDLGFMLLGFVLEKAASLPTRFDALKALTGSVGDLQFHPPDVWRRRTAPTHRDPWRGRLLIGEVDDENAWAIGGAAGHAGLFGNAAAVGDQARHLLQVLDGRAGAFSKATLDVFIARRPGIPGSSRALGWDTMLPTSSCGRRMSPRSFGHTGFTGTSLWLDPDRRVYVVLLTNRVYPDRQNQAIAGVRPTVHDAVMSEIEA
ncbi:MAG TPA: serine hydrolase domain-containing protein [Vicinamibacterales bacterium]|nr:serine hydrolase domain-containing protein [Vicinamibacterales bacterium]